MQTRILALVAVVAGGVLLSTGAQAIPSLSLIWQANGTATIGTPTITGSSTIVVDLVFTTDVLTVNGVFVSVEFDAAELQAVSIKEIAINLPGMGNAFAPLLAGPSLIDNANGLIEGFDQTSLATGLVGGNTVTLGSVTFHVLNPTGLATDIDVIASLQNPGIDTIINADTGFNIGANFIGASVTVPEPTSALLVAAGLVGLGYAGRRSMS